MKGPKDFEDAMHGIYVQAKADLKYTSSIYLDMLFRHGGLGTAKRLINAPTVSAGYTTLYEHRRLDLTVEALVVENEQWHALFEPSEIERAQKRLEAYKYTPKQQN